MKNEIWFPAKRYGFGWGLPVRWQGWLVLAVYVGLLAVSASALHTYPAAGGAGIGVLSGLLILICWRKGEPPKWRWGGKDARS